MDISESIINKIDEARKLSLRKPDVAFEMSKEAYEAAKMQDIKAVEAYGLFVMALSCRSMTRLNECFDFAYDALKIYETCHDPVGTSSTLNLMGVVYFYYAMYEQALEYFLKALHLIEDTEDYITLSRIHNNLGEVYREAGNTEEALNSYHKALDICEKHNYRTNIAVILDNVGEVYYRRGEYAQSFECYKQSYEILHNDNDITALAELENRIGRLYFIQEDYEKARDCYNHALKHLEDLNNKFFIIDVLVNLAELEKRENKGLFIDYLIKAAQYGEEINARKKLSPIYKQISEFYQEKGDFELALEFFKRYHQVEQEIETAVISKKLEIIKIELSKALNTDEMGKITKLNKQLEREIESQNKLLEGMERANRSLRLETLSDELTNIPNRKGVRSFIAKEWEHIEEGSICGALLMIDIDYFKRYNDCHGHLAGDHCIKKIADSLLGTLESHNGIIGRYGGEEFVCFVKEAEYREVEKLAEQLRNTVEQLELSYIWEEQRYSVTISVGGIYGCNRDFESIQEMILLADKELYKAKQDGRNKIRLREK